MSKERPWETKKENRWTYFRHGTCVQRAILEDENTIVNVDSRVIGFSFHAFYVCVGLTFDMEHASKERPQKTKSDPGRRKASHKCIQGATLGGAPLPKIPGDPVTPEGLARCLPLGGPFLVISFTFLHPLFEH